jgi:hypothetical protein
MATFTRLFAKFLYGIMGAAFLAVGISTLLVNTGLLSDAIRDVLMEFSQNNVGFLHIIQELGTLLVLVGLLSFWCVWNYDHSRAFHWMLTIYWALMALIHWFNVADPTISVVGGLVNTIPVAVFLTIGLLRARTDNHSEPAESIVEQDAQEQHA